MSEARPANMSTFRVIAAAVHAYPAVKFAFGVTTVLAVVGLVYFFGLGVRLAVLSVIPSIALLAALWYFAHAQHHAPRDFEVPANVLVQASLVLFILGVFLLFQTLLFGIPHTIKKIEMIARFAFPQADTDQPVLLGDADIDWSPRRRAPGEICATQRAIYAERYPSYDIDIAISSDTRREGSQIFYRYHCAFKATPK